MRPTPARLLPVALVLTCGLAVAACGGAASSSGASGSASAGSVAAHRSVGAGTASSGVTHSAGSGGSGGSGAAPGVAAPAPTGGLAVRLPASGPDVVEHAALTVRVGKAAAVAAGASSVEALAGRDGGYVQSSSVGSGPHPTASLTVRVPDPRLPAAMASIATLGSVRHRSQSGVDVTGQVVDLAAEQVNLQSEEGAVRKILDRATKVSDVLTIQQELFSLQGEIQQLQAQRNSLANQVAYADLAVTLVAAPAAAARPTQPGVLARFWHLAAGHTVATVRGVVLAVGWAFPGLVAALVAGGLYLAARRLRRRSHAA